MNYRRIEYAGAIVVFVICSIVYILTAEPSMSLWDCGEFISCATKQQVGHPPGAPFFLIVARALTFYLPKDKIALGINILSGIFTALACMFLFLTTTVFTRRILYKSGEWAKVTPSLSETIVITGSGIVAAFTACFADSIWFSAVEAEVYACSLFFIAFVVWLAVKWLELRSLYPEKNHYYIIVLIGYLVGLSIGVHLLSLLAIPFIALVIWYNYMENRFSHTRNFIYGGLIGSALLLFVQYFVIQYSVDIMDNLELFLVNGLGIKIINTGVVVTYLLLLGILIYLYRYFLKRQWMWAATISLSVFFVYIGYSTYGSILLASLTDPSIDQNNPENPFTLLSYLRREQYGDRPLIYGQFYSTPLDPFEPFKDGEPLYYPDFNKKKYVLVDSRKSSVPNY